jgi:WhiB family redox-sensing transcriptional regulator
MVLELGVVGLVEEQLEWRSLAACIGVDQNVFFLDRGGVVQKSAKARAICATCPVRIQCLAYAVNEDMDVGIWGGQTSQQRNRIARRVGLIRKRTRGRRKGDLAAARRLMKERAGADVTDLEFSDDDFEPSIEELAMLEVEGLRARCAFTECGR